jgi:hypothetical protein
MLVYQDAMDEFKQGIPGLASPVLSLGIPTIDGEFRRRTDTCRVWYANLCVGIPSILRACFLRWLLVHEPAQMKRR